MSHSQNQSGNRTLGPDLAGSLPQIWRAALEALEAHPDCECLPPWFRQNLARSRAASWEDNTLLVLVPSQLTREWLDRRYRSLLETILSDQIGAAVTLLAQCGPAQGSASGAKAGSKTRSAGAESGPAGSGGHEAKERPKAPVETGRRAVSPEVIRARLTETLNCSPLNPRYNFGAFVAGENNRFAQAAASAVAQAPGVSYNPLFIHGGVGLGKTHLMHAIGQEIASRQPDTMVACLSGEAFTTSFVTALRERRMEEFRRQYRHVDVWLVDDIQFIASKERTGEEFFHTFNALCDTGRQVVLCSDRPPHELQILDERMISRFEAGLVADIAPPSYETRLAILEQKIHTEGGTVPRDVLEMMARMIRSNVRVLEGALIRLLAHASFTSSTVNLQMATSLLSRYFDEGVRVPVRVETVQRVVCDSLDLPLEALMGKRRDRRSLMARQMAMFLSRELTDSSLEQIGDLFGGKDHSTVAHACRTFKQVLAADAEAERLTTRVRERIRRTK